MRKIKLLLLLFFCTTSLFVWFNLICSAVEWSADPTPFYYESLSFVLPSTSSSDLLLYCELNRCNKENDCFIHVLYLQDEGAELPFTPPMRGELFAVRSGVRPKLQRSAIEVGVFSLFFQFYLMNQDTRKLFALHLLFCKPLLTLSTSLWENMTLCISWLK